MTSPDADDDREARSRPEASNEGDSECNASSLKLGSGMSGRRSQSSVFPSMESLSSVSKFNSSALESESKGQSVG